MFLNACYNICLRSASSAHVGVLNLAVFKKSVKCCSVTVAFTQLTCFTNESYNNIFNIMCSKGYCGCVLQVTDELVFEKLCEIETHSFVMNQ